MIFSKMCLPCVNPICCGLTSIGSMYIKHTAKVFANILQETLSDVTLIDNIPHRFVGGFLVYVQQILSAYFQVTL